MLSLLDSPGNRLGGWVQYSALCRAVHRNAHIVQWGGIGGREGVIKGDGGIQWSPLLVDSTFVGEEAVDGHWFSFTTHVVTYFIS